MFIDNEKIGCLKNGGYMRHRVAPGEHLLEVRKSAFLVGPEPKIRFYGAAGEIVFIEWTTSLKDAIVVPTVAVAASEGFVKAPQEKAL